MIKQRLNNYVSRLTPSLIRNLLWGLRNRLLKKYIIIKWIKNGRPFPPPHQYKQFVIEQYQKKFNYKVLIETGTFTGDMVEAQKRNFDRIYSIELSQSFWNNAVKRFKNSKHIQILQGDSGKVLDSIIKDLDENAIFWLDGHYSSGDTAKGEKDCPIYEEIDAIFRYKALNHVLIIDDAGSFNGSGDYPTIDELTRHLKKFNHRYDVEVNDEIIRCVVN